MGARLINEFLDSLSQEKRQAVTTLIDPLGWGDRRKAYKGDRDDQRLREIDFGPPIGKHAFWISRDPATAGMEIAELLSDPEAVISYLAEKLAEEMERENAACTLPDIEEVRELHKIYPIFGFLIVEHDVECVACNLNRSFGSDERIEDGERVMAETSEREQRLFVEWGRSMVESIFALKEAWESSVDKRKDRMKERAGIDPEVDLTLGGTGPLVACPIFEGLHQWRPCPFAINVGDELLEWFAEHPHFLRNFAGHACTCETLHAKCRDFERRALDRLPTDVRRIYEEARTIFREGEGYLWLSDNLPHAE